MKIDCRKCEMYRSRHCDDCLVTALLHPVGAEVDIDDDLGDSLKALTGAGLVPVLKFRARSQAPSKPERKGIADAG